MARRCMSAARAKSLAFCAASPSAAHASASSDGNPCSAPICGGRALSARTKRCDTLGARRRQPRRRGRVGVEEEGGGLRRAPRGPARTTPPPQGRDSGSSRTYLRLAHTRLVPLGCGARAPRLQSVSHGAALVVRWVSPDRRSGGGGTRGDAPLLLAEEVAETVSCDEKGVEATCGARGSRRGALVPPRGAAEPRGGGYQQSSSPGSRRRCRPHGTWSRRLRISQ